jgi:anti-sigma28 factor (negative regulator of flagellin synthesis)
MKGITGHRIHDAYASMASRQVAARPKAEEAKGTQARAPDEAASVNISEGARKLAEGKGPNDTARLEELRKKADQGPSAFNPKIVAERMLAEFAG